MQPELFGAPRTLTNAWADFDADGDPDLFIGMNGPPNRLYRNDSGVFTDVAADAGIADARPTRAAAWADFDADGDPDLLVGFTPAGGPVLALYRNDGGRFTDVATQVGLRLDSAAVRQPAWIDLEPDGDLDLFLALRDKPNAFFRNDGGRFTNIAADIGLADTRRTVGAVWFDYDQDGDLDLYTGNMDGDANGLFRNDGGRFTDIAEATGLAWGGRAPREPANGTVRPCAADVDNDGRLDIFTANYGPNGLFLNRGNGRFTDVSAEWRIAIDARYDTCAFADIDHDGRLDLYVNGTVTGGVSYRDYLFLNRDDRFVEVTPAELRVEADHGVQWADFDRDGDLDIALTGATPEGMHSLLRNMLPTAAAERAIHVNVLDARGIATRAGAEIRAFAAGTRTLLATAMLDTGSGYDSQNSLPAHLGLPNTGRVDIEISFHSRNGRQRARLGDVDPRQLHTLTLHIDDTGVIRQTQRTPE